MQTYPITPTALLWLATIFEERFGHACSLEKTSKGLRFALANDAAEGQILFPFQLECFTKASSDLPCTEWDAEPEGWCQVLGKPLPMPGWSAAQLQELFHPLIEMGDGCATIHYDIPGLTWWMLNRIEEIGCTGLDNHDRFPAINSHAYKHGYLERPVVDEWLHVLGQVVRKVWPHLELKQHQFSMKVSHDVDSPSRYVFRSWKGMIRALGGDLIRRKDFKAAVLGPFLKLFGKSNIPKLDPYNTFDWLMDLSDKEGLTSAFYFICGGSDSRDADYSLKDVRIRKLMRHIHARGHEIGLHPSYQTYQDPQAIKQEADTLRKIFHEESIHQPAIGGRMHYLRWEHPATLQAWEDAGLAYDSTLSYADRPGFRCGTCHEYPAFNPLTQQALRIRIRPLIVMECSIMSANYLGLGHGKDALELFYRYKDTCKQVDGCFTLLWHNSQFELPAEKLIYEKIISSSFD